MMMISYIILKKSTEHANKSTTNDNENTKKSILSRLSLKVLDVLFKKDMKLKNTFLGTFMIQFFISTVIS